MTEKDKEKLEQLAAFGPIIRDPKTVFGKWHPMTGKGTSSEPYTMPWFEYSDVATRFSKMLYDAGWVALAKIRQRAFVVAHIHWLQ